MARVTGCDRTDSTWGGALRDSPHCPKMSSRPLSCDAHHGAPVRLRGAGAQCGFCPCVP